MLCLGCELLQVYLYRYTVLSVKVMKRKQTLARGIGESLWLIQSQGYTYTTYITYAYIDLFTLHSCMMCGGVLVVVCHEPSVCCVLVSTSSSSSVHHG